MSGGWGAGEVQAGVGGDQQHPRPPVQGRVEDGRQREVRVAEWDRWGEEKDFVTCFRQSLTQFDTHFMWNKTQLQHLYIGGEGWCWELCRGIGLGGTVVWEGVQVDGKPACLIVILDFWKNRLKLWHSLNTGPGSLPLTAMGNRSLERDTRFRFWTPLPITFLEVSLIHIFQFSTLNERTISSASTSSSSRHLPLHPLLLPLGVLLLLVIPHWVRSPPKITSKCTQPSLQPDRETITSDISGAYYFYLQPTKT